MPVPKKRTSKSAKKQRRSHHHIEPTQLVLEKTTNQKVPRRLVKAAKLGIIKIKEI